MKSIWDFNRDCMVLWYRPDLDGSPVIELTLTKELLDDFLPPHSQQLPPSELLRLLLLNSEQLVESYVGVTTA